MRIVTSTVIITILMELLTIILRFGFKLESSRDTASTVGRLTFGLRIHHGYIGVLMVVVAWCYIEPNTPCYEWFMIVGISLSISDFIHHVCVLWPIVGNPEFHLIYPKTSKNTDRDKEPRP